jgi:PAS domain S-box-containing protein
MQQRTETDKDVSRGLLEALFRDSGVGVAFFDVEGRYERVNDRLAAMHDMPAEAHIGMPLEEVVPDIAGAVRTAIETAVGRGETVTVEITGEMPDQPGVRRAWNANFVPVRDEADTIAGCASIVVEVTARKRAEDRAALVAAAATLLDTSLDLETTVRSLCRIAVPRLAGWCSIELQNGDGELVPAAVEPDGESLLPATLTVPLRARGRAFGQMTFASARPFSSEDRELIVDLTDRAALAVDNARLHTELQRTTEAQRFLAEAGQVLSASLDWETTCQTVAHLATTGFADWCSVHAIDTAGELQTMASAHINPEKLDRIEELHRRFPIDLETGYVARALLGVEPQLIAEVDDAMRVAIARSPEHLDVLRAIDARSVIIAPMVARGRSVGAILLAITESDRRYGAEDVALATELARRAAVAADNARLYSDRSRVARTLQRSLLPARLPDVPGLELAPLYRAAGDEVAGDFYDVFATTGDWGLVIGDVCGKGAAAAALTSLARHTVRAASAYEYGAAGVLRALHAAVLAEDVDMRFLTAAFLRLTPTGEGPFRGLAAVGGHLPPVIVRADGAVERIAGTGPLLGALPGTEIGERPIELGVGDVLVLATDGVTDAGAPDDPLGEEGLVELSAAAALAGLPAAGIAEEIAAAALGRQPGRMRDDVTLLVARVTSPAA